MNGCNALSVNLVVFFLIELDLQISSNALIKRASLKMQSGQQVEAFNDFNLAVAQDPENSDVYHHKGQVVMAHILMISPGVELILVMSSSFKKHCS